MRVCGVRASAGCASPPLPLAFLSQRLNPKTSSSVQALLVGAACDCRLFAAPRGQGQSHCTYVLCRLVGCCFGAAPLALQNPTIAGGAPGGRVCAAAPPLSLAGCVWRLLRSVGVGWVCAGCDAAIGAAGALVVCGPLQAACVLRRLVGVLRRSQTSLSCIVRAARAHCCAQGPLAAASLSLSRSRCRCRCGCCTTRVGAKKRCCISCASVITICASEHAA